MVSFLPRKEKFMSDIETIIKQQSPKGKNFKTLVEKLSQIDDPRVDRMKLHPLESILAIYLCATVCNRTGWDEVFDFAQSRAVFFQEIIPLPNGIPSADTFSRVIERINPKLIQQVTLEWHKSLQRESFDEVEDRQISLDGKTLRLSHNQRDNKKATHIVNAWSSSQNLVLAQEAVLDKCNEISAMREMLNYIDIDGTTVSIDAIGCQTEFAETIISKKADYFFALKTNQLGTHSIVRLHFEKIDQESERTTNRYHKTLEKDHGRIEKRECFIAEAPSSLKQKWQNINTIGVVISYRTVNGKTSTDQRYFITSLLCNAAIFMQKARNHWAIENSLHWVLDVDFKEDASRIRSGFAPQNSSWFRCLALSLLKKEPTRLSIRRKILKASDDLKYLIKVLFNSTN